MSEADTARQHHGNNRDGPQPHRQRIAVVGAGICGLRIAHLLVKHSLQNKSAAPLDIVVFERQPHTGGYLRSLSPGNGHIIESGAQGVLSSRTVFLETLEDLNFEPADVLAPNSGAGQQARYILTNAGVLARLSPNLVALWRVGLVTPRMILRCFSELFRFPGKGRVTPLPRETLYQFFARHFGRAWAESFIVPMATGIWGGASERLLLKYTFPRLIEVERRRGSLLRFALFQGLSSLVTPKKPTQLKKKWPRGLLSFPAGLQTLTDRMQETLAASGRVTFRFNAAVESLERASDGQLLLNNTETFDSIFWTSAPWQSPALTMPHNDAQNLWLKLQQTPTHNLIVVHVSGQRSPSTKNGFGLLASRNSDGLLGVLFVHSIYEAHVPRGQYAYRVLLGGDRNPAMVNWSDAELVDYAVQKLAQLGLIADTTDTEHRHVIKWPAAIGIADADHDSRLAALWQIEALHPGLHFAGIYKKGVGVADALMSAQDAVDDWLSEPRPNH